MAGASIERRLAAILAADVVGYSRLMGVDERGTLERLKAHRREFIEPTVTAHHGRTVKLMGDGALVEFASVVDAVACAGEIQRGMALRNADVSEEQRIEFRVGINLGDVIVEGDDIYGDGVNVAARLETLADPSGIIISGTAFDQVEGKLDYGFEFLGEKEIKNIAKPVRAYRVRTEPETARTLIRPKPLAAGYPRRVTSLTVGLILLLAAAASWHYYLQPSLRERAFAAQTELPLPDEPSIAVLPFDNLSGDPEQEYFSDGITESLITNLSQVSELFVIARGTMFTFKDRSRDAQEVGRELGVRYVLEGSVQRADSRVRITAQLIDAATAYNVWAEQYDRELEDLFALQDEVTQEIVSALEVELTQSEREQLAGRYTDSVEAYDAFLRGLEFYWRYSEQSVVQARSYFERAIELDPEFARAYANLARTFTATVGFSEMEIERAYRLVQKAIALDDSVPEIHWIMGIVRLSRGEHAQAIASMEKALALNPNYADSYGQLAWVLTYSDQPKEALRVMEKAIRLNPHYTWSYSMVLGEAYFTLARYDDAIAALEEGLERNPTAQRLRMFLAASYAQAGRLADAEWEVAELLTLDPDFSLEHVAEVAPYQDPEPLNRLIGGARKAGLT
jgi:adenylate cyclase